MGRYFIGGTKGSSGKIYLNKGNDNFAITNQTELNADASFEIRQPVLMLIMMETLIY
jgi:hypothetical protein